MTRKLEVDTDRMPDMTPEGLRHRNPRAREIGNHVYDFESASKFLGDKSEKKLAANTKIFYVMQSRYYGNETIAVKFHQTIIVQYMQGGIIQLNTGGHRTVTTKQRINQLLPPGFRVEQRNYEWLLHTPSGTHGFADNMIVSTVSGNVKYHESPRVTPQVEALPGMTPMGFRRKNPKGQARASNPGKHDNALNEGLYVLSLDGNDGAFGDVHDYGAHYSLLLRVTDREIGDAMDEHGLVSSAIRLDPRVQRWGFPLHAIVSENSDGFVSVEMFPLAGQAEKVFLQRQADYEAWLEGSYDE